MQYSNAKIGIVVSKFNSDITKKLLEGAQSTLVEKGVLEKNLKVLQVPGAVEIPLMAKMLAKTGEYQAIICLGCVIRGETNHYDYVCQQVSYGCQKIMLEFCLPIVFGVLTTENEEQAYARVSYEQEGHKGAEAALCALDMIQQLSTDRP